MMCMNMFVCMCVYTCAHLPMIIMKFCFFFQNIENFMKYVYRDRYGEEIQEDSVKLLYSLAVSIFAIGGMLGGFSGGMIANKFGR